MNYLFYIFIMIWCILGFCGYGFLLHSIEILTGKKIEEIEKTNGATLTLLWGCSLVGGVGTFIASLIIFLIHKHYAKQKENL